MHQPCILLGFHGRVSPGQKAFVLAESIDSGERLWVLGFANDQQVVVIPQYVEHALDLPADQLNLLAQPGPFRFVDAWLAFRWEGAGHVGPESNEGHELHCYYLLNAIKQAKSTPSSRDFRPVRFCRKTTPQP